MLNIAKKITVLGLVSMLVGCGGGGGGSNDSDASQNNDLQDDPDLVSLPYALESFDNFSGLVNFLGGPGLLEGSIAIFRLLPMHGLTVLTTVAVLEDLENNQTRARYDRPCSTGSANFVGDPLDSEGSEAKYSYIADRCIYAEKAVGPWAGRGNDGYFDGSIDHDFTSDTRQITTFRNFYIDSDLDDLSSLPPQNYIPSLTGTVWFDSIENESEAYSENTVEITADNLTVANHGKLSDYKYTVRKINEIQDNTVQKRVQYDSVEYKAQYTLSSAAAGQNRIAMLDFISTAVDGYYDIELKMPKALKVVNNDRVSEGSIIISLFSHQIVGKVTFFEDGYEVTHTKAGKSQVKRVYY
jgi:hypothetical protein